MSVPGEPLRSSRYRINECLTSIVKHPDKSLRAVERVRRQSFVVFIDLIRHHERRMARKSNTADDSRQDWEE